MWRLRLKRIVFALMTSLILTFLLANVIKESQGNAPGMPRHESDSVEYNFKRKNVHSSALFIGVGVTRQEDELDETAHEQNQGATIPPSLFDKLDSREFDDSYGREIIWNTSGEISIALRSQDVAIARKSLANTGQGYRPTFDHGHVGATRVNETVLSSSRQRGDSKDTTLSPPQPMSSTLLPLQTIRDPLHSEQGQQNNQILHTMLDRYVNRPGQKTRNAFEPTLLNKTDKREWNLRPTRRSASHSRSSRPGYSPKGWLQDFSWKPLIDPHKYKYLVNPRDKCKHGGTGKDLNGNIIVLILVSSAVDNEERRDVIRQTWMQGAAEHSQSVRMLFLLGDPGNSHKQNDIYNEAETYDDILQEDFLDSYYNLSIKTIMGFKWATNFCKNSHFVMKVDDDVIINVPTLVNDLATAPLHYHTDYAAGKTISNSRVIRDPRSKWYTPVKIFSRKKYPPYLVGHGYVISIDLAQKLYRMSQRVEIFPWEDTYVGILLEKLEVSPRQRRSFTFTECVYQGQLIRTNLTLLALTKGYLTWDLPVTDMLSVWNAIEKKQWSLLDGQDVCSEEFIKEATYLP